MKVFLPFHLFLKLDGDITNLYGLPMKKLEHELALLGYQLDDFKEEKVCKKYIESVCFDFCFREIFKRIPIPHRVMSKLEPP